MIKLYLFILTASFVFLFACNSSPNTTAAKLKIDSLQYSAYRWRINLQSNEWELFLAYYIKIDQEGNYKAMRHNTTPEPAQFFKGVIDSSERVLLDSLPLVSLDTAYFNPKMEVYDGNTFHLNYAKVGERNIDYYQKDAPPFLKRLSTALDSVIFQSKEECPTFPLYAVEEELKKQSLRRLGGLPKLEKAPIVDIDVEKYRPTSNKRLPKKWLNEQQ